MELVAVFAPKGGVGKSTLALNLAGAGHFRGKKVAICDVDPQGSLVWASKKGNLPFKVYAGSPKDAPDADIVIFDYPPHDAVGLKQKKVVAPYRASAFDFVSANQSSLAYKGATRIDVCNAVDFRIKEQREHALKAMKKGTLIVKQRSIYARMSGEGRTVFDDKAVNISGCTDARNEMLILFDEVMRA